MAKTRSTRAAPAKASGPAAQEAEDIKTSTARPELRLESRPGESPKVFILPSQATSEAKIVTLPHPRHSQPSRYLVCPQSGLYEFTKISAPKSSPRSWLLEAAVADADTAGSKDEAGTEVTMGSDLFVATSFDPLFLILPALSNVNASSRKPDDRERLFCQSDDILDRLPQEDSHMSEVLRWTPTRALIEARMAAVCDTVDAGDETMYRLSEKKLLDLILAKAKRMSREGLPASMEERFVKRRLQAPLVLKKTEIAGISISSDDTGADPATLKAEYSTSTNPSQSTLSRTDTETSSISQPSTAATSLPDDTPGETLVSAMEASPDVVQLQRLRISFAFICSTYLTADLASQLQLCLKDGKGADSVDFSALDDFVARLEKLRTEKLSATSTADFSRRRRRDEEEEDERQEKKRKMEEAKKKKAAEGSRALRDLKKVDTSGMKKLSAFFTKK